MSPDLEKVYQTLFSYCETRDFAGHDPFDGLSSSFFRSTPLKHSATARLAWLQIIKRSPIDLRRVLKVRNGVNAKGLALFALAEFSRFRASGKPQHAENGKRLIERLLTIGLDGKSADGRRTLAFGYNFDWQSRNFFAPVGTPAIVPTAFASQALVEAYELLEDERYLNAAREICDFVLSKLNRSIETEDEICFSYTPIDNEVIFNANLLAGESLARVGAITGNGEYLEMAAKTVRFALRRQRGDGAWSYGAGAKQGWVDNFHTAYVLLSLFRISGLIPDLRSETYEAIRRGTDYWLDNFFLDDGTPKYYDSAIYPVDIHSAAVAVVALCELSIIDARMLPLAIKTGEWTISNMRDDAGFFYYQARKNRTIKTPFMRWGQSWMAYALARLIERTHG